MRPTVRMKIAHRSGFPLGSDRQCVMALAGPCIGGGKKSARSGQRIDQRMCQWADLSGAQMDDMKHAFCAVLMHDRGQAKARCRVTGEDQVVAGGFSVRDAEEFCRHGFTSDSVGKFRKNQSWASLGSNQS